MAAGDLGGGRAQRSGRPRGAGGDPGQRRLQAFLRKLPHDFANAILPFQIAADLLRRARGDAAVLAQVQQMLEEQSAHAQRLIEGLERASRVVRGELELKPERCDLDQVVDDAIAAARAGIEASVTIARSPSRTGIVLTADRRHLSAAIQELVDNAARFAGTPIQVDVERAGGEAMVRVGDRGPGIPPERMRVLFEPFAAAEAVESGWGIGLGFVQLVAAAHGGAIEAAPGPGGNGTVMTLRLPLEPLSS